MPKKKITLADNYFAFLRKQVPRVYIPLLFWSVVSLALAVSLQNKPILHEVLKLVCFQSFGIYYFIALIIQYYLLFPILKRFANSTGLVASIIISITMTGLIFYVRYYIGVNLPLIIYAGNFATWMMFFVLGLYLGTSGSIKIPNKLLIFMIFAFYVLSCAESYVICVMFHQAGSAVTAVKASSFMYSFALIVFLFKNHDFIKSKLVKNLGEVSFGIYLIHNFVLIFSSRLLLRFSSSLQEIQPVYQIVIIGLVVSSCFIFISLCRRVLSTRQIRLIGFS